MSNDGPGRRSFLKCAFGAAATAAPLDDSTAPGLPVAVSLAALGFTRGARIRGVWTHRDLGEVAVDFTPVIPFHGAGLCRLTPVR